MDKLITEKSQLPQEQQQAIEERLQVLYNKALLLLEQMPESFEDYVEKALKECNDTMREMVEKSSDVCNDKNALSYIFVIHKERKKDLERLKEKYSCSQQNSQKSILEPLQVPKELTTTDAKKVLRRAITAGLLKENFQAEQGVTRAQQKEFADLASQVLKISNKWVVFGTLWGIKNLGQVKTIDARPEKLMAVRKLFPDLDFDMDGKPINKKEKFS